ncbi:wiskott-Aldrich syndrome protein family member 3b isoform X1 [Chiloscyllium plagiosum]|uniref:wiskott-Aldrich syndrome protein family member 3b isoform X1 n=1 Tax=Chiloscyllium plagiosum TaxID=36176 RepID=UPI001CB885B9|nr:wiskott-Aldrich syndrome protein family member 3b isoform X1 [Chiloscyllium plagiosum]XP_043547927.1 wiskott-Aldrich syndrome protein family member 3b isoform X1 [Chiloscyllium plagiosum]XP_043547928.1 wiskott-Aldrich syndrome protein family member 3b isoform X1 [Chiloscyllium plagiosum]XP_043547930.1 wiskott-Aldrich syndrome protein family member 3b isoform X1 [Chiloscyllium plagiosum]
MPLVKRNIEPRHLCHGALPDGISNELECVTNNTLAAIIRQLSSLSKHAEDIFGELFNEANNFHIRANSLQDRIDRLAVKVTQLDSTVEEVSLQDINLRKAFKSSTIQDQQVVSKSSTPNPVLEMYTLSDKPPPLDILSAYRDDKKDGLKFYTDPSYFFDLWKEKMLQDTEDKRKEKRRQKEQKRIDGTTREVKKVRKAKNRRQEWNMMAYDKELRPDNRLSQNLYHGASSEGSVSPDNRSHGSDLTDYSYPVTPNHVHPSLQQQQMSVTYVSSDNQQQMGTGNQVQEHDYKSSATGFRHGTLNRPQQPPPPPPSTTVNGGAPPPPPPPPQQQQPPLEYSMQPSQMMEFYTSGPPLPSAGAVIPSAQTAFVSPVQVPTSPASHPASMMGVAYTSSPTLSGAIPPSGSPGPPPPPPPPAPPAPPSSLASSPMHCQLVVENKRHESAGTPLNDARSDLLAAIRMGIQLKKVQEQREQEAKREPVGNDVATILSRRIAVEYSDSDDDSELDENDWSD